VRVGLAALVLGLAARAAATPVPISDDDDRWRVDLPVGWAEAAPPDGAGGRVLAAFASGTRRLVVARLRGNTEGASAGKASFFAGLEEGARQESPGYQRLSGERRHTHRKHTHPVYDLWYRSDAGVRGVRFVFTRSSAVVATLSLPGERTVPKEARRLLESFGKAPSSSP
jgi:hypothetical protein